MYVKETKLYSLVSSPEEIDNMETIISLVEDFKDQIDMMGSDLDYGLDDIFASLDGALVYLNSVLEHMEIKTSNEDTTDNADAKVNTDTVEYEIGAPFNM